jgi:putative Mn2+ efflux pump MntP
MCLNCRVDIMTILVIALGLSMDAFAVAIASGSLRRGLSVGGAVKIALFFGGFQALMPAIGWFAGEGVRGYAEGYDHWVAFALLSAVGAKMIYESFKLKDDRKSFDPTKFATLLILAVATSIDALMIGFSLSFLGVDIVRPAAIIGAVTFAVSLAGVFIGKVFGHIFESKIEFAGGLVLIGIGLKILLQHIV